MATPYELAKARFRPGVLVEVKPDVLETVENIRPEWNALKHGIGVEMRTTRVIKLRDSDDDPTVCVCATSNAGVCASGWFDPETLIPVHEEDPK